MSDCIALSFRDVSFSYARTDSSGADVPRLIDGLSLDVPAGYMMALLGPNGCGKSTLLRMADGLLVPASGAVEVADGRDGLTPVLSMDARRRARAVALLPQIHRTPSMTVESLVMCGRYAHMGAFGRPSAEDRAAVKQALDAVGISSLAGRQARRLSGGQRQCAFIAMALAQQAPLLLLDEPTTYLDVRAAHDIMSLVRRLVDERGLTVLAVMHDLDLALRCSDRIAVMDEGRIMACGSPQAVVASGALSRALGVDVVPCETPSGTAYATFPTNEFGDRYKLTGADK